MERSGINREEFKVGQRVKWRDNIPDVKKDIDTLRLRERYGKGPFYIKNLRDMSRQCRSVGGLYHVQIQGMGPDEWFSSKFITRGY